MLRCRHIILIVVLILMFNNSMASTLKYQHHYSKNSKEYTIMWNDCGSDYYITKAYSLNGNYTFYKITDKTKITVKREKQATYYKVQPKINGIYELNNVVVKVVPKLKRNDDYITYAAERLNKGKDVTFDGYKVGATELKKVFRYLTQNYPALCLSANESLMSYSFYNNSDIYKLEVRDKKYLKKTAYVVNYLKRIKVTGTDEEKARKLHDFLLERTTYDYSKKKDSYYAFGVVAKGRAVCQGYAMAYKYLCNNNGIPCEIIIDNKIHHAWNQVKIKGRWYNVDVTWDDCMAEKNGEGYKYNYFLVSDKNCHGKQSNNCDSDYYKDEIIRQLKEWTA